MQYEWTNDRKDESSEHLSIYIGLYKNFKQNYSSWIWIFEQFSNKFDINTIKKNVIIFVASDSMSMDHPQSVYWTPHVYYTHK